MSNIEENIIKNVPNLGNKVRRGKNNNKGNLIGNLEIPSPNWNENKLEKFMILLVLGYFGIKIFYALFGIHSPKPLAREVGDFTVMIILGWLLYLLTNMQSRTLMGHLTNINWLFFLGFLIGLNAPAFQILLKNSKILQEYGFIDSFIYGILIVLVISFILLMFFSSIGEEKRGLTYYALYLLVITVVLLGLIYTRKQSQIFSTTKFEEESIPLEYPEEEEEELKPLRTETKKGYIETGGTYLAFGLGIIGWLVSLIFMYDPVQDFTKNYISFFNGLFIGLFVGGASFNGIGYLFGEGKDKEYQDIAEKCRRDGFTIRDKEYTNMTSSLKNMQWILALTIITVIVMIILFYMAKSE